ncbi:hypothetical protein J6590_086098 [Homalodisca vitripennis]|nr:hypothetical protein J6590_095890 [Homalodisca vitripennis]KAG8324701.1 hypothetical protein J6590_086098 [Homalodisca vitripennis]
MPLQWTARPLGLRWMRDATAMDSSSIRFSVDDRCFSHGNHLSDLRWMTETTALDSSSIRYSVDKRFHCHGQLIHQMLLPWTTSIRFERCIYHGQLIHQVCAHPSGIRWMRDASTMDSSSIRFAVYDSYHCHEQLIHQQATDLSLSRSNRLSSAAVGAAVGDH